MIWSGVCATLSQLGTQITVARHAQDQFHSPPIGEVVFKIFSFLLFEDKEKYFDSLEYELIFRIMQEIGVPEALVSTWRRLYEELKIRYKVAGCVTE